MNSSRYIGYAPESGARCRDNTWEKQARVVNTCVITATLNYDRRNVNGQYDKTVHVIYQNNGETILSRDAHVETRR